jgi:hypothetical protein
MVASLDLESTIHKILFAVWFEYEDMDWCLTKLQIVTDVTVNVLIYSLKRFMQ